MPRNERIGERREDTFTVASVQAATFQTSNESKKIKNNNFLCKQADVKTFVMFICAGHHSSLLVV